MSTLPQLAIKGTSAKLEAQIIEGFLDLQSAAHDTMELIIRVCISIGNTLLLIFVSVLLL